MAPTFKIKKVSLDGDGNVIVKAPSLPADLPKKAATGIKIFQVTLEGRTRTNRAAQSRNGHWKFDKPLCGGKQFGFIYLIRDNITGMMYIGKKQFLGTGVSNRGQETNWKWYTSSCEALQDAIKISGKDKFDFFVLDEYRIRGTLGYAETWSLMHVKVPENKDKWYNRLVNKISWTVKEGISEKHEARLKAILNDEQLPEWSDN